MDAEDWQIGLASTLSSFSAGIINPFNDDLKQDKGFTLFIRPQAYRTTQTGRNQTIDNFYSDLISRRQR